MRSLYEATDIAAMCLQDDASMRPLINDVVTGLTDIGLQERDVGTASSLSAPACATENHHEMLVQTSVNEQ